MFNKNSLRNIPVAAAMAAALLLGGHVQAQTKTAPSSDSTATPMSSPGVPKTAEERTAAKTEKAQAKSNKKQTKAAKRAARKSRMNTNGADSATQTKN